MRQKANKFYIISHDVTKNPTGMVIDNEKELKRPGVIPFMPIDTRIRGFSHFLPSVRPLLRYDRKRGRLPKDLEKYQGRWLITKKLKDVFESVDPSAFEFLQCDIVPNDRLEQSEFWLGDVIRIIECVDETDSKMMVRFSEWNNRKSYFLFGGDHFVIKNELIGENIIFRPRFAEYDVICSQSLRNACREKKIQGVTYRPVVSKM